MPRESREWVGRHFSLREDTRTLAYLQKADDDLGVAAGVLPLAAYDGVADAAPPRGELHAFQLTAAGGDGDPERSFVLAASSAEEKAAWVARLQATFAAMRADGTFASAPTRWPGRPATGDAVAGGAVGEVTTAVDRLVVEEAMDTS